MSTVLLALNPSKGQELLLEKVAGQLHVNLRTINHPQEVLDHLNSSQLICLVVCDAGTGEQAFEAITRLDVRPTLGHVALVEKATLASAVKAGRSGAIAILDSQSSPEELAAAIKTLIHHETMQSPARVARAKLITRVATLAPTEHEVYRWVLSGVPNKMIAKRLQVSQRTIEARRQKVFRKLEVMSVAELVRITALYSDIESVRAVLPANEVIEYDEAS